MKLDTYFAIVKYRGVMRGVRRALSLSLAGKFRPRQTKSGRKNDRTMNTIRIVVTFALMLAGLVRSHAQLQTSAVPVIEEPPALPPLALPLMKPSEVPESGNFFSVQRTNWPPLPFCPIPGLPVYLLETTASGSP